MRWMTVALSGIWPLLFAGAAFAYDGEDFNNSYVDIRQNEYGGTYRLDLGMGTTGGYANVALDDHKRLLYRWPEDTGTTYSTLRILAGTGIADYRIGRNGSITDSPHLVPDGVEGTWEVENVRVIVRYTIVNGYSGLPDTCRLHYRIQNLAMPRQLGLRIMLDTMIGDHDEAPIHVPGTPFTTLEREWIGRGNVPDSWLAFENNNIARPGLVAMGVLRGLGGTPPDKFQIGWWQEMVGILWNYAVHPNRDYTAPGTNERPDSAVALYYNPVMVGNGEELSYITHYGLRNLVSCEGDLGAVLDAPTQLDPVKCTWSPNPFWAALYLRNNSLAVLSDIQASIVLEPGLVLVNPQERVKFWSQMAPSQQVNDGWQVLADGTVEGQVRMHVYVAGLLMTPCILEQAVNLLHRECTPTPTENPEPTGTPGPTATPTATPVATATPEPTPGPRVLMAGYGTTRLEAPAGGSLAVLALVDRGGGSASLAYQGTSLGIALYDDGLNGDFGTGDGVFGRILSLQGPLSPARIPLEVVIAGSGNLWPWLQVR